MADLGEWLKVGNVLPFKKDESDLDPETGEAREDESAAPADKKIVHFPIPKSASWRDRVISARELCDTNYPPLRWVIPGLITEGLTLLVGRPKLGKSWLLLQILSSVALGALTLSVSTPVEAGDVLSLNLEDGNRRLQRRMKMYFGDISDAWPPRMTIAPEWRKLDGGGLDDLRDWCKSVERPTLIGIDTIKKIRPAPKSGRTAYDNDYETGEGLLRLCHEFPGLGIITAHHDRKMDADDVFDTVSGTLGLTGGVDAIAILKRSTKGTFLHIQGRDFDETIEKAVYFDRESCRWQILGDAAVVVLSKSERLILEALEAAVPNGLGAEEIMKRSGLKPRSTVDSTLSRMVEKGSIERQKRGVYVIATDATP